MYGPRHPSLFEQEKIAIRMISDKGHALAAVLDETGRYSNHSVVLIAPYHGLRDTDLRSDFDDFKHIDADIDIHYVLAIILSKLESFYFKKRFATESLQGSTSHTYPTAVRGLVIKNISKAEQNSFVTIADQILTLKKQNKDTDTKNLESQIDQMVYKLYGLTPEEIKIVEGSNG